MVEAMLPDFAHKPDPDRPYSLWTMHVEEAVQSLPKSAILLWKRLLRSTPGGVQQLVRLKELGQELAPGNGNRKGKGYCLQTLKNAVQLLSEARLLRVIEDFGRGVLMVTAYHPGPVLPLNQKSNKKIGRSEKRIESSQKNLRISKKTCGSSAEIPVDQAIDSLQIDQLSSDLTPEIDQSTYQVRVCVENNVQEEEGKTGSDFASQENSQLKGQNTTTQQDPVEDNCSAAPLDGVKKTTEEGFEALWAEYCGTKAGGSKGSYELGKAAYLALPYSDGELLALYRADLAARRHQADSSPDGWYESFPHFKNYCRLGNIKAVEARIGASHAASSGSTSPAWSSEQLAYYAKLQAAALVDETPVNHLPEQMGKPLVRFLNVWNTPDAGFTLRSLDEVAAQYSPEDIEAFIENREQAELMAGFIREAERGMKSGCESDMRLGIAGLRSLWLDYGQWIQKAISQWLERFPHIDLFDES